MFSIPPVSSHSVLILIPQLSPENVNTPVHSQDMPNPINFALSLDIKAYN